MKKISVILSILLLISFSACKNDNNKKNNINADTSNTQFPDLVKVKDKLFNVPSPIQASYLVEKNKIQFNSEFLNKPSQYSKYLTTFQQALNIGVYGSNLATLFVYDQLSLSAQYLSVVKKLSEQIGIFNSINQTLYDRIEKNSENRDSLLYIISDIYKEIDNYLAENDQQEIGVLILAGGWIESMYLLTQMSKSSDGVDIKNRIAEQKVPLSNIIQLLEPYKDKTKEYDTLYNTLSLLNIEFENVEENYVYQPSETFADKHLTVIHSKTSYNITQEQIVKISDKIDKVRRWIIK